jgi:spore photoproduct lyase
MIFEKIYIEEHLKDHNRVLEITSRFPQSEIKYITKIEDVFGRVKKPYLEKRDNLNLFLGEKKGQLVKVAPPAYGLSGEPHYYFVHAYNCIYECNYCYLQGYFQSPDIVLFLNHDEVAAEIKRIYEEKRSLNSTQKIWFHAGEYSDSLALSHLTGELPFYFNLFSQLPNAYLELRTKSVNIKELLKLNPLPNTIISFSLAPAKRVQMNDLKTPSLKARLEAISKLHQKGFRIGLHFDPIIYDENVIENYKELISQISRNIPFEEIQYISIGVVRFTKNVYHQVMKNYPDSDFLADDFIKSFDNKIRYNKPTRLWLLGKIKSLLIESGMANDRIYECMEETILEDEKLS